MPVPSLITDLSTTPASNSPAGSENVFPSLDDYLRAQSAFLASVRDNSGNGWVSPYLPLAGGTMTGTVNGLQMASANGGQLAGLRNKIINGDMRVAQRGTVPFTVSLPAAGTVQYTADRFEIAQVTAATSAAAVGGIISDNALGGSSGTHIYLQTTVAKTPLAAGDYALIQQNIEGFNVANLKYGTASAKTVTISFKALISSGAASAVISVSLRNSAVNRSYVIPITITNTAATYSVTIPGDTSGTWLINNGVGLRVGFCCGAGSTYTTSTTGAWQAGSFIAATGTTNFLATATQALNITDVQLEVGPVATPFEQRPIGMELALCQRYYYRATAGSINNERLFPSGLVNTTTACQAYIRYPVTMRATPSDTGVVNATNLTVWSGGVNYPVLTTSAAEVAYEGTNWQFNVTGPMTVGYAIQVARSAGATPVPYFEASAEL